MSGSEIDRFPVNQLQARYGGLARSAVYKRLDDLGIKPLRIGNRAFINGQELQLMDDLHQFIQRGGSAAEFRDMRGMNPGDRNDTSDQNASGLVPSPTDVMGMFASLLGRTQPPNPLSYLEQLEQACQQGWILSTSEVAKLLKITPEVIAQYPQGFTEAGFAFKPAGQRMNGEPGWRVEKFRGGHLKF
ncbi:MAG: hypothetical protein AAF152_06850 [Cyanobacteria bacterium P01_A01_bin.114]